VNVNLDYDMLKQRVALDSDKVTPVELAPRFVELYAAPGPMTAHSASEPQCVVELANARGARMRVELNGQGLDSLSVLCSAFLGAP